MNYLKYIIKYLKTQPNTCLNDNNLPGECSAKKSPFLLHQMLSLMSAINPGDYYHEVTQIWNTCKSIS